MLDTLTVNIHLGCFKGFTELDFFLFFFLYKVMETFDGYKSHYSITPSRTANVIEIPVIIIAFWVITGYPGGPF